ncbi:MAG: S8 family serine peptidase, partial [Bacteroidota bacterium]
NLTSAINTAASSGRGGLGCVVAFSSGNSYGTCVNYPARLASVIAVGAFGNDGIISDYSNEGPTLDIVAPSNDVSSAGFLSGAGVRTIDRMGSSGYSSTNYTTSFGGTSASCPVVAGVAALVLSVDASLTDEEVKNILYTTAIDMGSGGFDNTYGNGRVNAFAAVQAAGGGGGGPVACSSTVGLPYSESFESGIGAWTQSTGDDLNWTRRSGGTPSSGTGPSGASDGSWYMYIEASSPNFPSKTAGFESPCFDLSGTSSPTLDFSYHMLGNAVGNISLDASTDGSSWTSVWSLSGTQGGSWNAASVDLSAYAGESELRLRFFGTTGSSWQGDICIDDLSFTDGGGGGGTCPTIDFNTFAINSYGGTQDNGTSAIQDGGATLFLQNNAWKSISYSYTVTPSTVIEFDFRSTNQGEIHGIGFDNNNSISSGFTFRVYGTQNWGIGNFDNYSGTSWTTYVIPVGTFYTGNFNRMFFVADDDAAASNNAFFRNIKVYEGSCAGTAILNDQLIVGPAIKAELTIAPNPARDLVTMQFVEEDERDIQVNVINMTGQTVLRKQFQSIEGENQYELNVADLAAGVYFVIMQDGMETQSKRLVIER